MKRKDFIRVKPRRVKPGKYQARERVFSENHVREIEELFSTAKDVFKVVGNHALLIFPTEKEIETDAKDSAEPFKLTTLQRVLLDDPKHYMGTQGSYNFNKPVIREVLKRFFGKGTFKGTRKPRIVVFAGFSGEFSKALQEIGFEVIHTLMHYQSILLEKTCLHLKLMLTEFLN